VDKRLYLKHFATLFSGTALAQVINFAAYPFLTRSYSAEDFGEFAIFVATAAFFGAISCGRFDAAIHAAKAHERFAVFSLAQLFNRCTATVVLLCSWLASFALDSPFGLAGPVLLAASVALTGYCSASAMLALKHEIYKQNSASNVIRTAFTAIPQLGLFYLLPNIWGLVLGYCLGFGVQALYLRGVIRAKVPWRRSGARKMFFVFKKYRQYLRADVPSQVLSVLSLHAVNYFLLLLFSAREVGYYSLSFRLAAVPLALFASSLSQVFFQKAAQSYHARGAFWDELKFNLLASTALSLVIFIALVYAARPVVSIYLGPDWIVAGDIMVYLAPMLALRFISTTIAAAPLVVGRPQVLLVNNLAQLTAISAAFGLGWMMELALYDYIILTSSLASCVSIVFILYLVRETRRKYS
jgi:O-antigen/teichoic acid export membrane protein